MVEGMPTWMQPAVLVLVVLNLLLAAWMLLRKADHGPLRDWLETLRNEGRANSEKLERELRDELNRLAGSSRSTLIGVPGEPHGAHRLHQPAPPTQPRMATRGRAHRHLSGIRRGEGVVNAARGRSNIEF